MTRSEALEKVAEAARSHPCAFYEASPLHRALLALDALPAEPAKLDPLYVSMVQRHARLTLPLMEAFERLYGHEAVNEALEAHPQGDDWLLVLIARLAPPAEPAAPAQNAVIGEEVRFPDSVPGVSFGVGGGTVAYAAPGVEERARALVDGWDAEVQRTSWSYRRLLGDLIAAAIVALSAERRAALEDAARIAEGWADSQDRMALLKRGDDLPFSALAHEEEAFMSRRVAAQIRALSAAKEVK